MALPPTDCPRRARAARRRPRDELRTGCARLRPQGAVQAVRLLPLAHPEDIEPLTVEERRLLCGLLAEVARGNIVGAGLRAKPGLPDLTGCRKLYFLGRHGAAKRRDADKGGWRVVYRYADDCIE